jgi:hypothetical protein
MEVDPIMDHMRVLIPQEMAQNQKLKGHIEISKYSSGTSPISEGRPPQASESDTS